VTTGQSRAEYIEQKSLNGIVSWPKYLLLNYTTLLYYTLPYYNCILPCPPIPHLVLVSVYFPRHFSRKFLPPMNRTTSTEITVMRPTSIIVRVTLFSSIQLSFEQRTRLIKCEGRLGQFLG